MLPPPVGGVRSNLRSAEPLAFVSGGARSSHFELGVSLGHQPGREMRRYVTHGTGCERIDPDPVNFMFGRRRLDTNFHYSPGRSGRHKRLDFSRRYFREQAQYQPWRFR